ncbi:alpha/beta hydrolase [Paraburkholderia jirisanensis]
MLEIAKSEFADVINEVSLARSPLAVRLYVQVLRCLFRILSFVSLRLASSLALKVFLTPPRTTASRWERRFEGLGTRQFVTVGDKQLRVLTHGAGDKTALLVHGWGSRSTHLGSYAESLVQAGYRVCSVDGPAHGHSTGKCTDMMEFAQAIAIVAQHVGPIDVVVGHSFGAACTLLSIDRFGLKAEKLILISCFAEAVFITESFARFLRIGKAAVHDMRLRLERKYRNAWSWERISPTQLIRTYRNPILLIHDMQDDEVPVQHAQLLQSNNPNAQMFFTENQGHRKILRDKRGIAAAITFLADTA